MTLRLDHVFVCCRPAPEPALLLAPLLARGARIGRARRHDGQGTRNHCVFFADAMLELLVVDDDLQACAAPAAPLRLADRADWVRTGASPFGICVGHERGERLPFATWDYVPEYLPPDVRIAVAGAATADGAAAADDPAGAVAAPLLFASDAPWAPPDVPHALAGMRVRSCRVTMTGAVPAHLQRCVTPVAVERGAAPLLELVLGGGTAGRGVDLRPGLPLRVAW